MSYRPNTGELESTECGRKVMVERLSSDLGGIILPIHQFVTIKVIFRKFCTGPALEKILIPERVQPMLLTIMLKDILRPRPHLQIGVIALQPHVLAENRQPDQGRIRIQFQFDRLSCCSQGFQ